VILFFISCVKVDDVPTKARRPLGRRRIRLVSRLSAIILLGEVYYVYLCRCCPLFLHLFRHYGSSKVESVAREMLPSGG
jgi:hypothetical protein